jgi:hypothetical protein
MRRGFESPGLRYLAGPGLLLVGAQFPLGVAKVAMLAGGSVFVMGGNVFADRSLRAVQEELRREDARHALTMLLQNTTTMIEAVRPGAPGRSLRANLMLLDAGRQGLRIAYSTNGYDPAEKALLWQRGQGCAGQALDTRSTRVAPEDHELPVSVTDADATSRPWNMTPAQIRLTAGRTASVISAPVAHPDDRTTVLGVFSLDDSRPLSESLLGSADVRAAIEALASEAGRLLLRAGLDIPEGG